MNIKIKGIKRYTSKGIEYCYHRKSGKRIFEKYGTFEFAKRVTELNNTPINHSKNLIGTWGYLSEQYRTSEEFKKNSPRTKSDYNKVFDYLSKIADQPLSKFKPVSIEQLKDAVFIERKRCFTNKMLSVMSLTFNFGIRKGHAFINPVEKIKSIPRDKDLPVPNRAWTDDEIKTVLQEAQTPSIRAAIALSAYTSLRGVDVLTLTWSQYTKASISATQSKTGNDVWIPAMKELQYILDATPKNHLVIVSNEKGKPYTTSGFKTMFHKLMKRLKLNGKLPEDLTFHGLRSTFATNLAAAGCTPHQIMAVTGHASIASVEKYVKKSRTRYQAETAIRKLEQSKNKSV